MVRRLAPRFLLMLVVMTGAGAWAAALSLIAEPVASGSPGDYVTLPFRLEGEGTYSYEVHTEEGWTPLATTGSIRLEGSGYMSVTLRVPRSAAAGARAFVEVVFQGADDPDDVERFGGIVTVEAKTEIALLAPAELEGELGRPLTFSLLVTNAGNQPDHVSLHAERSMWDVRLERNEIALAAGEAREVVVELVPLGEVSSGYRLLLPIRATSRNDPDVTAAAFVEIRFYDVAARTLAATASDAPRLALTVRSGLGAGVALEGGVVEPDLSLSITPGLTGALSDYVDVGVGVGSYRGSVADPFEEVPSRLDVALDAETWDAAASIGPGRYGVAAGAVVGDWRVSGGANLLPEDSGLGFGVSAFASSLAPDLDLQFSGRTSAADGIRRDAVGARYRTPIADGLVLSTGLDLTATADGDPYRIDLGVHESLSYQTQRFDVTQSYSGVPLAGLHNVGLSGGLRGTAPFGVRASTSLQFTPDTTAWRNTATLTAAPAPGLRASLSGIYQTTSRIGGDGDARFGVRPILSYRFGLGSVRVGASVGYAYAGVLRGDALSTSTYFAGLSGGAAGLEVSLSGSYLTVHGAQNAGPDDDGVAESWQATAAASYAAGRATTLDFEVGYAWERELGAAADTSESTRLEASWTQAWTDVVRSQLSYERSVDVTTFTGASIDVNRSERIAASVELSDLGIDGLVAGAGYALSSDTGLLTGLTPLRHDLRVRLGYALALPFDTPEAIVDVFGGRRGGGVEGVAYVDRDLDGERDANEPAIAGMTVRLGGAEATTDDAGRYRLRVPSGTHAWIVVRGAPASTEPTTSPVIEIADDSEQSIDLPFVPVVPLNVTLFDDTDNDGERASSEVGVSFGGVIVEGPVRRVVRVDGRGTTVVTGLVPGEYVVRPDPAALPERYRATTEPVRVTLREGQRPAPVLVGAGAPPRQLVTTFSSGALAVFARANEKRAPAGAELQVTALVSGAAEDVTLRFGTSEVPMAEERTGWVATVRIPPGTAAGPLEMQVLAVGAGSEATASVTVTVVEGAPFRFEPTRIRAERDVTLRLETMFAATSAEFRVGDTRLTFVSDDGYRWTYDWAASDLPAGSFEGTVVVDGDVLGRVTIEPVPPEE